MAFFARGTHDELRARRPGGRPYIDGRTHKRIFHARMYSERDGFSGWAGSWKVCPGICLWNGMQFPVEGSGGKCDPEINLKVGCSFPTGPQAETASHSGREFRDKLSAMRMPGHASATRRAQLLISSLNPQQVRGGGKRKRGKGLSRVPPAADLGPRPRYLILVVPGARLGSVSLASVWKCSV